MTLLLDLALRSSVLLAAGLLLNATLAKRSAALRHRVLVATLLAAALVVPLSVTLPEWTITLPVAASDAAIPPTTELSPSSAVDSQPIRIAVTEKPAVVAISPMVAVWVMGLLVATGALIGGLASVGRVASRASRVDDARWLQILDDVSRRYRLNRQVAIARTDSADLLATWGIFRPQVLLPHHALDWTLDRVHVVLCHELAHVRRHDWFVQLGAEAVRAILWFNPLVWIACTRLRRESEQACDDEVLGLGVDSRDYAAHLLDIVRRCRRPGSTWVSAVPMAHPSTLERRISAMLNPSVDRQSPSRSAVASIALVVVLVTLPVAAIRARQAAPAPVNPAALEATVDPAEAQVPVTPTKDNRAAASTSSERVPPVTEERVSSAAAALQAAPLTGTIYDVTGAVMPGVQVALIDANKSRWTAVSSATGRFELPTVSAGKYLIEVTLTGFRTLRNEIELRDTADWDRAVTLQVGELTETITVRESRVPPPPPQPPAAVSQPIRVGGNIRPPTKIKDVRPVYPAAMREAGLTGIVPIEAIIGRDGTVSSIRVLSAAVHPDFAVAAADAVRKWLFTPTLLNTVPVEVVMTVSVRFDLEGNDAPEASSALSPSDAHMASEGTIMPKQKSLSKRQLIDMRNEPYVKRDAKGRLKESDDVLRSLSKEMRRAPKTKVHKFEGDKGDR